MLVSVAWARTHIHEQVRRGGGLPAHGAVGGGCWRMSHSHYTREARRRRRGRSACAERARLPRAGPHRTTRAPTATGCLISHYNLRVARFLPLLLPRFVLRIIECIPLAPAAMRTERRPDNSRMQLRRSKVTRRWRRSTKQLPPSCNEKRNCTC